MVLVIELLLSLSLHFYPIVPQAFFTFRHQVSAILPAALFVPWLAPHVVTPDNFSNLLCCVKRLGAH